MPESVAARLSISGSVSSLMAETTTSAPWARAASSRRKGKRPLPAMSPSFMVPRLLQNSAFGAFDELDQISDVVRCDALVFELLDSLRRVHPGRQQQAVGM